LPTSHNEVRLQATGSEASVTEILRALAQRIEVDVDEVRIMGSNARRLQALTASGSAAAVPTRRLKWRRKRT
jgi:hypothetical protein